MKKMFMMAAAGVLAVSLTACGGNQKSATESVNAGAEKTEAQKTEASQEKTETEGKAEEKHMTMTWWGNQVRNERTEAALDLYSEENPGVTFDSQPAEWNDYWVKLNTAAGSGELPDLVQMDYKYLAQFVDSNSLVDLTPYMDDGTIDTSNINPSTLDQGKIGDKIYAVSLGLNAPAMFYNKTLTDQLGIEIKDNMSMDEFISICKEIYEKSGVQTTIAYNDGENFIEYMMRDQGYVLFENGKLGVPGPEPLEKFFALYEQGVKEGWHVSPDIYAERTLGSVEQQPMVYGGEAWCQFNYSNQLTAVEKTAKEGIGFEVGITTWPADHPEKANYLKPSQFISLSVDSKNPEEAAKVINYFTNSQGCNDILLAERGVPISSVVAADTAEKLDDVNKRIVNYINDVVTPSCSKINPPSPDGTSEVLKVIDQLEEKVCYGEMTAAEAAKQLFEEGNKILGSK